MMTMVISGSDGVTFPDSTNQFSGGAFSFKNRIINGDMRIDQRNAGASVNLFSGATYVVDRFTAVEDSDGAMTAQQVSDAPTGFVNSIKITTTTADGSLAAGQYANIQQRIEGTSISDLAWGTASAKTITLSFWVRSSLTGTFSGSLRNSAFDRTYVFTYSISSADTWEQKAITIVGDTSGTWLTTTGVGIRIALALGAGTDFVATAGSWGSGNYFAASGTTNVLGTLNATFYITGVQLEVGSVATPFERRPFGTELNLCLRYYYKLGGTSLFSVANGDGMGVGRCTTTTGASVVVPFPVPMRAKPSALEQSGTASDYIVSHRTSETQCSSVPVFSNPTAVGGRVNMTVASGLTAGDSCLGGAFNTSAFFAWSAEL
jgi:hypothetical protein